MKTRYIAIALIYVNIVDVERLIRELLNTVGEQVMRHILLRPVFMLCTSIGNCYMQVSKYRATPQCATFAGFMNLSSSSYPAGSWSVPAICSEK
jgi:hypothetical protein